MERPQDQPLESTIYGYAKFGNMLGFQKLLRDNPNLLNKKHSSTGQTPLHVSATYNKTELVKFLLALQGPEKVELEAKNKNGETPLHIATKNGCNDVARVLLAHGAFVEAKEENGMTPLHFSIFYSSHQSEDCAIFKTLLEYNADCSAKDDEGMTPLDHLPQDSCNKMLIELLDQHVEEQKKKLKAIEACRETKEKMKELENELSKIVGSHELKIQLQKWAKGMVLDERRRALGLKVGTKKSPHMAFLGNPGTGKTMIARTLGKLLHMVGVLPTDKVIEVQRTDLIGEYVGQTGVKTRSKIKEAEGGILFVDEAYRLMPMQRSEKDYGLEALEEIMSVMDSGEIVVIFAGYRKQMQHVIDSNEGFHRRVTKLLYFNDFSSEELANILHIKMDNPTEDSSLYGFKLHPACTIRAISNLIERGTEEKRRKEMNGGLVDQMLVNARENLDGRLSFDCISTEELRTIAMEDLEAGIRLLTQ